MKQGEHWTGARYNKWNGCRGGNKHHSRGEVGERRRAEREIEGGGLERLTE